MHKLLPSNKNFLNGRRIVGKATDVEYGKVVPATDSGGDWPPNSYLQFRILLKGGYKSQHRSLTVYMDGARLEGPTLDDGDTVEILDVVSARGNKYTVWKILNHSKEGKTITTVGRTEFLDPKQLLLLLLFLGLFFIVLTLGPLLF